MPSPKLAYEVSEQELMDPKTPESIEFDDLDTILPSDLSANEAASCIDEEFELEVDLEAEDIDSLLSACEQQLKR